jgi:uncharacterized protein
MSEILILGATGALGSHVAKQAVTANHKVALMVRRLLNVPRDIRRKVMIYETDLAEMTTSGLATIFRNYDAVINTAGNLADREIFVDLVDHIVTSLELIPETSRPVCWFLAGAAVLDMDDQGRKAVDLPLIKSTYWPHRANFERISRTTLDWRILCPGPLVDQPPVGLSQLRVSLDRLPIAVPSSTTNPLGALALPFFTNHISEMIVPYSDAAGLMLENLTPQSEMSRHRVGLALPIAARSGVPAKAI